MTNELLVALSTLGGASVSGLFMYLSGRQKEGIERLERKVERLKSEVRSRIILENVTVEMIAQSQERTPLAVKREMRAKAREYNANPKMTESFIDDY